MTLSIPSGAVVAATDASPAALAGVRFAAHEARGAGVPLVLAYVVPGTRPGGAETSVQVPGGSLQLHGRRVLARTETFARGVAPGVELVPVLRAGDRVCCLLEVAEEASSLVVGTRRGSSRSGAWAGRTVTAVAERAEVPVVAVPSGWDACATADRVLVGLKTPAGSGPLLEHAFAAAQGLGAEVLVVHAWQLDPAYEAVADLARREPSHSHRLERRLDALLHVHRLRGPDVTATVRVVHESPAAALSEASGAADRLFVSRPRAGEGRRHTGETGSSLLRDARCPVVVVPPTAVASDDSGPGRQRSRRPTDRLVDEHN